MITKEATTSAAVNFSVRVNRQLKVESEALFRALGMNMSTAIQCFLKQAVLTGGLPFEVRLPLSRKENYAAWQEAKEIATDSKRCGIPVEQALAELAQ